MGRALAIDVFGEPNTNIIVAGITSGSRAYPSGERATFPLNVGGGLQRTDGGTSVSKSVLLCCSPSEEAIRRIVVFLGHHTENFHLADASLPAKEGKCLASELDYFAQNGPCTTHTTACPFRQPIFSSTR